MKVSVIALFLISSILVSNVASQFFRPVVVQPVVVRPVIVRPVVAAPVFFRPFSRFGSVGSLRFGFPSNGFRRFHKRSADAPRILSKRTF